MTITTYRALIDTLAAITFPVTLVDNEVRTVTIHNFPITNVSSTECPVGYVRLPINRDAPISSKAGGGWPEFEVEVVILVMPAKASLPEDNFANGVAVMDAFATQLRQTKLAKTNSRWEMRFSKEIIASYDYWSVVTEIMCNG